MTPTFEHAEEWAQRLAHLIGTPCELMEIGAGLGEASCWMLNTLCKHEDSRLVCIDVMLDTTFDKNVEVTGRANRLLKYVDTSDYVFNVQRPSLRMFDFVYIGTATASDQVLRDAINAWQHLKQGGLMCFGAYGAAIKDVSSKIGIDSFTIAYTKHIKSGAISKTKQLWITKG